ncbi:MAG: T9SS type A sorting domain-containing protein [Paludibacteraceae bacterium]|nr:T9SS type A sorting domain-containing protein [Paludibacteraceae bacterium]
MKKIVLLCTGLLATWTLCAREVTEIEVDSRTRSYTLYFPEGRATDEPTQLVVMLHGLGQTMDDYLPAAKGQELANTYECAILVPQAIAEQDAEVNSVASFVGTQYPMLSTSALAHVWNAGASATTADIKASLGTYSGLWDMMAPNICPNAYAAGKVQMQAGVDDVKFINAAIDQATDDYNLKPEIWMTGLSLGGAMCYRYAFSGQSRAAKIAVVSGFIGHEVQVPATIGLPVMVINSRTDEVVTYEGNLFADAVETNVNRLAQAQGHGAFNEENTTRIGDELTGTEVRDYEEHPRLLFYKVLDADHTLGNLQGYDLYDHIWTYFEETLNKVKETQATTKALQLYPNPAGDVVYTETDGLYTISDLSGRTLLRGETDDRAIVVGSLSRGRYLVTLQTDQNCYKALLLKR